MRSSSLVRTSKVMSQRWPSSRIRSTGPCRSTSISARPPEKRRIEISPVAPIAFAASSKETSWEKSRNGPTSMRTRRPVAALTAESGPAAGEAPLPLPLLAAGVGSARSTSAGASCRSSCLLGLGRRGLGDHDLAIGLGNRHPHQLLGVLEPRLLVRPVVADPVESALEREHQRLGRLFRPRAEVADPGADGAGLAQGLEPDPGRVAARADPQRLELGPQRRKSAQAALGLGAGKIERRLELGDPAIAVEAGLPRLLQRRLELVAAGRVRASELRAPAGLGLELGDRFLHIRPAVAEQRSSQTALDSPTLSRASDGIGLSATGRRGRLGKIEVERRRLAPELLEPVAVARLGDEDVQDAVEVVERGSSRLARRPRPRSASSPSSCLSRTLDLVGDRLRLALVARRADDQVSRCSRAASRTSSATISSRPWRRRPRRSAVGRAPRSSDVMRPRSRRGPCSSINRATGSGTS